MEESYKKALEEKNYREALRYYQSFEAMEEQDIIKGESKRDLRFAYVLKLFEEGRDSAAISEFYDYLSFDILNESELKKLEPFLVSSGIRAPLEKLFDYYVRHEINADPSTLKALSKSVNFSDMDKGTVTVWVNRGIRIENGIGIPDRVIGSGFFIDRRGYILTNYHVIASEVDTKYEGYSRLFIKLSDDSEERIPAKVVGWDNQLDIALLKCEVDPEYIFSLAEHYNPSPGDQIFAIGSPGGLKNTRTSGSVSTLNRQLQAIGDTLQIDVPINPGNSGGPLLHHNGEVLGVVFAGIEQFEGINFAIPVSDVKDILPDLYEGGEVEHSWLGCALFERLGKLEVLYVLPDSPARQIGLKKGDIIESVNGKSFNRITDIQRFFLKKDRKTLVRINWLSDKGRKSSVALLEERPETPMEDALKTDAFDNLLLPFFGMDVERVKGKGDRNILYNLTEVYPGTTADEAGLSVGDSLLLRKWENPIDTHSLIIQIIMKTRKAGFIETAVQIGTAMEKGFFI